MVDFLIELLSAFNKDGKITVAEKFSFPGQIVSATDETFVIEFTDCSIEHPVVFFGIRNREHSLMCNVLCNKKFPLTTCVPVSENGFFRALNAHRDKIVAQALQKNPAYNLNAHVYRKTFTLQGRTIDAPHPLNMVKYNVDISVVLGKNYHFVETVRVHLPRVILEGEPRSEKPVTPPSTANVIDASSSNATGTVTENKSDEDTDNNHE